MRKTIILFTVGLFLGSNLAFAQNSGSFGSFLNRNFGGGKDTAKTDNFRRLRDISDLIEKNYVTEPDYQKLTEKTAKTMLSELDPHSVYIAAKDVERSNEGLQANFEGVGISFQIVNDTISVTDVIVGGPSEKVGVQIGDKLLMVDDTVAAFKGVNNNFVFRHLRGKKGTHVKLTMKRLGLPEPIVFDITRDKVPIYSVDTYFMLDDTIGYLRLARFARTSHSEVHNAIVTLRSKGMKRLIFDLRGNSGGYLDIACGVASELLEPNKLIVYTEGDKSRRQDFRSMRGATWSKGPLVVLIDEYSASASEIVSGAVQDWDRGTLVGRRSFGKGLVQRMFELYDGAQVRLTTARYYTPSGRCIQKPYEEGTDAYNLELKQRYDHKEFTNADSVSYPDSLKYYTSSGRVVYGGGGIMPDVFVPIDTIRLSDYFISLRSAGVFNTFALNYADQHRNDEGFATFDGFLNNYDSLAVAKAFGDYAATKKVSRKDVKGEWVADWVSEQVRKTVSDTTNVIHANNYDQYLSKLLKDQKFTEQLRAKAKKEDARAALINRHSDIYMGYLIKALIARNLYGIEYYYRVMKDDDEGLQKAIQTVKSLRP